MVSAVGKLLDNRGFAEIIATYQFGIPEPLLLPLGLAVSLFELAMAIAIFAGIALRPMAVLTIVVHLGYTLLATLTNLRGLDLPNCGCFGVFLARPMTWSNVIEDAILTALGAGFYAALAIASKESSTDAETSDDPSSEAPALGRG